MTGSLGEIVPLTVGGAEIIASAFPERQGITGMVVVADAGMLSAGNLNAIEDAGFSFKRRPAPHPRRNPPSPRPAAGRDVSGRTIYRGGEQSARLVQGTGRGGRDGSDADQAGSGH